MGAFSVTLNQIINECNLEIVYAHKALNQVLITTTDVSRPGLQFVDFFDYVCYTLMEYTSRSIAWNLSAREILIQGK